MQPTPAKIKSFLGTIKSNLENEDSDDPVLTFCTLLKIELLLRGVLVEDDNKVFPQVLSSAGKALLNESSVPKQLLAAVNVIAGTTLTSFARTRESFEPDLGASSSALKRAQDIKDQRFIVLLQQDFDPLEVAKGYFSRAASISPDTPPMWKKLWDVISAQHNDETAFASQTAIENLVRIADSKGNSRRSTELRLKLIQCYLNVDKTGTGSSNVSHLFGDATTSQLTTETKDLADLAKSVLQKCAVEELTEAEKIMYQILKFRVEFAAENAVVEQLAQQQLSNDKNRSRGSSISDIRSKCRKEVLSQSQDSLERVSFDLRDELLRIWQENADTNLLLCLEWTQSAVLRFRDRAQANETQESWDVLLRYTMVVINAIKNKCDWSEEMGRNDRIERTTVWFGSIPKHAKSFISLVSIVFPDCYFSLLGFENYFPTYLEETFRFLLDMLFVLQRQGIQAQEGASTAVGSKRQGPMEKDSWKQAEYMAMCFICQDDTEIIFRITRDAVTRKEKEVRGGSRLLQCLVSWSGWFQSPWPFCSSISDARRLLSAARADPGRPLTPLEGLLLDLASADAELLQGGFAEDARCLYVKVLSIFQKENNFPEGTIQLLKAHSYNGLARVCETGVPSRGEVSIGEYAQLALRALDCTRKISQFYIWHESSALSASFGHQLSLARQLIANSLVVEGRCDEAHVFLQDAVNDRPLDAGAAFALGSFLLRMAFHVHPERSEEADKIAQVQLLRAAKIDPSKAGPFSLLGLWFEEKGDVARAKGCYKKSLSLDQCNPVSGRGLLRLESNETSQTYLELAIDKNSSQNGWAWHAVGLNKVLVGEDDLAIVALLKSLRCRDITQTSNEPLGIFYQIQCGIMHEHAAILEECGQCYRRLGRYTAAIRAFHAAISSYEEDMVPSSVLCSCAQVELELALFEDSAEKFSKVLQKQDAEDSNMLIAAYGQGVALLSIATRDLQDGKAGTSFSNVQRAIEGCLKVSSEFICIHKLLGDLFSFGALVPSSVFNDKSESNEVELVQCLEKQLSFVSRGEDAYRSAFKLHDATEEDGYSITAASSLCDVASNLLCQAQILSRLSAIGPTSSNAEECYKRATNEFERAIALNPIHSGAWCGLGCAVKDRLTAQHAFCRSLQIERMLPDGYANLGLLYTELGAFAASEGTMNALTQVADSPMMWIIRALMLERKAASGNSDQKLAQAADAYRAALQVMKQPEAILGLAMTGRVCSEEMKSHVMIHSTKRKDCHALMNEFLASSVYFKDEASLFSAVMSLEQAAEADGHEWSDEVLLLGTEKVKNILDDFNHSESLETDTIEACMEEANKNSKEEKETEAALSLGAIQRSILQEPHRPELWLSLAKGLVGRLEDSSPSHAIESGYAAALRASNMLTESLKHPRCVDGQVTAFVNSKMISESLSMVYFLVNLQEAKEGKHDEKKCNYALQRSIMMCPNSGLAREALVCSS